MANSANPLQVTVVSATATVWEGQASQVIAKTSEGEIGIRADHTPVLAILADGNVRVSTNDGKQVRAHAADGFLSVANNVVTIVAGEASIVE
ncbi:F0F1 ATP synthase subunit epsilon [Gulosibacter faecalis]|jgi:F-type H+-transporting ATPase subunit epsilon|uniref:F0F1 ATP synthase subunit epsilon n=1 Tax=Gulosibacter faecalis TaxID=272240 RepID=A0ABW5UXT8_9MICO|nr:F0F1 ATP synthase subunit epsilon [Gulosibacter faecalis]